MIYSRNMSITEFAKAIAADIRDYLPEKFENAEISVEQVNKKNDTKYVGIVIRDDNNPVNPTIYLEDYYEDFINGREVADILNSIASFRQQYDHANLQNDRALPDLTDLDAVKDKIRYYVVNADWNKEFLSDKPHQFVEDLAKVYYIGLDSFGDANASCPITNNLLKIYGITENELDRIAEDNMTKQPPELMPMMEIIKEMIMTQMPEYLSAEEKEEAFRQMYDPEITENYPPMFVLSNEARYFGAAYILSSENMDKIAEKLDSEFVIIPSSVHECIILPVDDNISMDALRSMVGEVNQTKVSVDERLSDNIYTYDIKERCLVLLEDEREKDEIDHEI